MTTKWMDKVNGTAIRSDLIPEINKSIEENRPFFPKKACKYLSFQSIFYANFNRFVAKDDEWFVKLRDEFETALKMSSDQALINWTVYGKGPLDPKYEASRDRVSDLINQLMDQRREELRAKSELSPKSRAAVKSGSGDLSSVIKDLEYESYLDYLLKLVDEGKITNSVAEVEVLLLFVAGYQNNGVTIEWLLVLMAKYPSIQDKVREELLRVHGIDQGVSSKDTVHRFDSGLTVKCPIFRAFTFEALRVSSVSRIGAARTMPRTIEVEWKGQTYRLKKGGMLMYNVEFMQTKSRTDGWRLDDEGNVVDFCLEHFLDENGRFKVHPSFSVFGYGPRDCPGKAFAIKSGQIVAANLIMNYKIEFGDEEKRRNPNEVVIGTDKTDMTNKISPEMGLRFSPLSAL